jgi:hypothetical protein
MQFTNMALTMLMRGKLHPEMPKLSGEGKLDRLYARVAELEGNRPSPNVGGGKGGEG